MENINKISGDVTDALEPEVASVEVHGNDARLANIVHLESPWLSGNSRNWQSPHMGGAVVAALLVLLFVVMVLRVTVRVRPQLPEEKKVPEVSLVVLPEPEKPPAPSIPSIDEVQPPVEDKREGISKVTEEEEGEEEPEEEPPPFKPKPPPIEIPPGPLMDKDVGEIPDRLGPPWRPSRVYIGPPPKETPELEDPRKKKKKRYLSLQERLGPLPTGYFPPSHLKAHGAAHMLAKIVTHGGVMELVKLTRVEEKRDPSYRVTTFLITFIPKHPIPINPPSDIEYKELRGYHITLLQREIQNVLNEVEGINKENPALKMTVHSLGELFVQKTSNLQSSSLFARTTPERIKPSLPLRQEKAVLSNLEVAEELERIIKQGRGVSVCHLPGVDVVIVVCQPRNIGVPIYLDEDAVSFLQVPEFELFLSLLISLAL
ncbi:hypothetical protein cyc_07376 [Cyclospora cayetanensis]|uniref:Uncharacterized protein n=1 Tax=Cyclospora cayetanensis TaxID=88456 RepID=A0A1D3D2R7_9EIME|nr:hypothetical protein cyc_07376 [Cyclospora cayetanensis]